jgi:alkaline phosphatase D
MTDSFIWKTKRPWPNKRLKRGAIVGHTTSNSTRLWFRTGSLGDFTLLLYRADIDTATEIFNGFKTIPYPPLSHLPNSIKKFSFGVRNFDKDTTHVLDIEQLQPDTVYCYALLGDDKGIPRILLGQDDTMMFQTPPRGRGKLSFGFYSCHMPYKKTLFGKTSLTNMEMWECFAKVLERHSDNDLQFIIGGGDQVYVDGVDTLNIWRFLNNAARREGEALLPKEETMMSWYRDIYRGYWGFNTLMSVFSSYPTYMMWDDHELGDGWGSYKFKEGDKKDELNEILPDLSNKGLSHADGMALLARMERAAKRVYTEYQHSHNPPTGENIYDFAIEKGSSAFYFLDGRGHRNINRRSRRILGVKQLKRFKQWLEKQDISKTPFLFILSAVPVVHLTSVVANADNNLLSDIADLEDDLRDAWEHKLHDSERRVLLEMLFSAAKRGFRITILSGDVHVSAAFRLTDDQSNKCIYQLTSSAITYNNPRPLGWILGKAVVDEGQSEDGYSFRRLALYTDTNFSLVTADPDADQVVFQLYGKQSISDPNKAEADRPVPHSIARMELNFS